MLYPTIIKLKNQTVIVIGAGSVAQRKIKQLLKDKARIVCIADKIDEKIQSNKKIIKIKRKFNKKDISTYKPVMAINASGDGSIDKSLSKIIKEKNILYNSVDKPEACNFYVPAVIEEEDLIITVSTQGKSPFMLRYIKGQLQKYIKKEWLVLINILGELRKKLKKSGILHKDKLKIYEKIAANSRIKKAIEENKKKEAAQLINDIIRRE